MIPTEAAILRLRRDLVLAALAKASLLAGATATVLLDAMLDLPASGGPLALLLLGAVWILLAQRTVRSSQLVAASRSLIDSGQFEQAEQLLHRALYGFSISRALKLRAMHHLAMLRHAQRRWAESAAVSRVLLQSPPRTLGDLWPSAALILADSLLELADVWAAYPVLISLYQHRLRLGEALELLSVQTDYLARIGAWEAMMQGIVPKIQLVEIMSAPRAARAQALLALGALKTGRSQWHAYLRRRAELLGEIHELVASRPALAELWPDYRSSVYHARPVAPVRDAGTGRS